MTPADRAQFIVLIKATRALAEDAAKGRHINSDIAKLCAAIHNIATMLEMLSREQERGKVN